MVEAAALSITVEGLPKLRRMVDPRRIGAATGHAIDLSVLAVEREIRMRAPRDTAALQRSVRGHTTGQGFDRLGQITSNLGYAPVMEFGRRPGSTMPPPQALAGWARRKGMGNAPSTLFLLARSIGRKGIKARHFFRDGARAAVPHVKAAVKAAARIIERGV